MNKENGLLVVLSSPSGGGKTTVIKNILQENHPDYLYSISMTTRPRRAGEENGKDYWFVSPDEFQQKIKNDEFIEYEQVHDWYYGTPKNPITQWVNEGKVVFLDVDVFGALRLKKYFQHMVLLIFLKPPNQEALVKRLTNRSTETSEQIKKRLERLPKEMAQAGQFDIVVQNDDLAHTVNTIKKIIAEKRAEINFSF